MSIVRNLTPLTNPSHILYNPGRVLTNFALSDIKHPRSQTVGLWRAEADVVRVDL